MFGEAMRMLAADDGTDTLLLVSKPPAREVVQQLGAVDVGGKRVVAAFVGWEGGDAPFEIHPTLDAGAFAAAGVEAPEVAELEAQVDARRCGGTLLGLYSGGSLAHEAVTILEPVLGPIGGNAGHGDERRRTRSSTSARRSTRRGARTRWSTSRCGSGSSNGRPSATASAACCSTS